MLCLPEFLAPSNSAEVPSRPVSSFGRAGAGTAPVLIFRSMLFGRSMEKIVVSDFRVFLGFIFPDSKKDAGETPSRFGSIFVVLCAL